MVATVFATAAEAMRILAETGDDESGSAWFTVLFILMPLALVVAWLFRRRNTTELPPRRNDAPPAEATEFLE